MNATAVLDDAAPQIAVIIATRLRPQLLRACLGRLVTQTFAPSDLHLRLLPVGTVAKAPQARRAVGAWRYRAACL